jgi:hypothetical protein
MNEKTAISIVEIPRPTIKLEMTKNGKDNITADGQKTKTPQL